VAIVTGANSGLGEAIAVMLAQRGASVTLCGRDEARLEASLALCVEASGGQADRFVSIPGDVTSAAYRKTVVQQTADRFGRLDILVANAGVNNPDSGILTATEAGYDAIMDINVKAVFFQIQEAVPYLESSSGNIVVISSISSVVASSPNIVYPMSKAAIDHMVRCLAVDLGPKNIRVNAVNPSFIPTRIRRDYASGEDMDKLVQEVLSGEVKKQPLGNAGVTREAIAEAVCYLSSDAASFVTGQCLPVDAGRVFAGPFGKSK